MGNILKSKPITGNSPSEFNTRITLEYPVQVPDGGGGITKTWSIAATVWAIVNDFQSDEMVLAMATTGALIKKIRIRYRTDVKSNWRVGIDGKYSNIIGPPTNPDKRRRWLDLRVKEAV